MSATEADAICARGLNSIENDDVDGAMEALTEIREATPDDDPRRLHLEGAFAWASGDLEDAEATLARAVERPGASPALVLDFAELALARFSRLMDAEAALRSLLDQGPEGQVHRDATVSLAQCRLADDDAEEALELLETVDPLDASGEPDALWAGTRAEAFAELGRHAEAVAGLRAMPTVASDADLQYLLGAALAASGDAPGAVTAWVATLELDSAADGEYEPIGADERRMLCDLMDEILETLPDPVLKRMALASVEVVPRVSTADVGRGADPRAFVTFLGTGNHGTMSAELTEIRVARNVLLDVLEGEDADDEVLVDALAEAVAEEVGRFFGVDLLGAAG